MTSPIRIFISYARKDGRDLALRLQKSLSDLLYDVWLDTSEIEGGDDWGGRIESAIDGCHILLALMSPESYTSEICRAEQLRAIRKEKRVIPILVIPCDRPIWLEHRNYRDFSNMSAYDTILAQLHDDLKNLDGYTAPTLKPIYNNAPPLPPHFIPRPDEYNKLKNALLSDTSDRQVALTALQGLGGIGKSVMANAVCKDDFLAGAFPDGVFWVEIGREPGEIVDKLKTIGVALGDSDKNYTTLNDAIGNFRNIIAHKSALIVLDDVWEESYKVANYFIGTSPRTRWLVTTRNQAIVDELDATPVQLGMMHPDQAVALMREWAGKEDDQFATIARRLGYHPLAVKIVGTRLKGMKSADWLNSYDITRVKMGLSAHDRDDNLVACFEVSVNSLPPELPPLYHALGIFPEDKWIPESMVARLWMVLNPDLAEFDCTEILTELAKLALVDRQADTAEIRMHDLLHDYNRFKIKAEYVQMQARFIGALGDPYHLPHEYAWRYYAYHLIEAGQQTRLRELLLDYPFLDAKLNATDVSALIEDCGLVLAHGKDEPIRLIQSALRMSSHVLDKDKKALAHQLAGRLMHYYTKIDEIRAFWDGIIPPKNSLFPINNGYDALNPAGGLILKTLKHKNVVNGAVELRSGRILSWGKDNTLRLWDSDGAELTTLAGHTNWVRGALELHDGRILSWAGSYFGSRDTTLRLWGRDGVALITLVGHREGVSGALELSSSRILSWSWDATLHLWDSDGVALTKMVGHTDAVRGALELHDGRILSWSNDKTLRLWDSNGAMLTTLGGHMWAVRGALELHDGRILSWSNDKTLRLWDSDGVTLTKMWEHTDYVHGVVELHDGHILSWSKDNTLRLWGSDGAILKILAEHMDEVLGAVELRDGHILSWSKDNTLRLWGSDGAILKILAEHTDEVLGAVELHDGHILSWSKDNTLRLWSGYGVALTTLVGHTDEVLGAVELHDGHILSWSKDNTLRLWGRDKSDITGISGHIGFVNGAVELHDGQVLSWSKDNTLRLWSGNGAILKILAEHTDEVLGAVELQDGHILSWSKDNTLRLWNDDGAILKTLAGHMDRVWGAQELANGRILSWSEDNTLRLWGSAGNPIDMLEQNYWGGDRKIIDEWAKKHGYTLHDFYHPGKERDPLIVSGRVKCKGNNLIIYDSQTGAIIHNFYGDAPFSGGVVVLDGGHIVVAGDNMGRVLFLRWVGEDEI